MKTIVLGGIILLTLIASTACGPMGGKETVEQTYPSEPLITFVSPQEGEIMDASHMTFSINPVPASEGYAWIFKQNGEVLWDTLKDEQRMTGKVYSLPDYEGFLEKVKSGELTVQVRARVKGEWSEPVEITVKVKDSNSGIVPTATAEVLPNATSTKGLPSGDLSWNKIPAALGLPYRGMQAAQDTNRNVVVMFGGTDSVNKFLNQTWEFDGKIWKKIESVHTPAPRLWSGMTYDPLRKVVVLFGGRQNDSGVLLDDTWEYDGIDWTQVNAKGLPGKRGDGPGMVFDTCRNKVVLFGGRADSGPTQTWEYDGIAWTQVKTAKSPPARTLTSMVFDANRCKSVLFGGGNNGGVLNDTWEYDGTNWEKILSANSPSGRWGHSMAYNPLTGHAILFGGYSSSNGILNDTWIYDGVNWQKANTTRSPSAREQHAMSFDGVNGQIIVINGNGSDDVWAFTETGFPAPLPTTPTAQVCGAGWTRLQVGDRAIVTPGDANWVRSSPEKGGNTIGKLYPGDDVKVVEGPACADNLVFWKVENAKLPGGEGWTAEGDGINYFLEPLK
jgi:hypothetical protein